MLAMPLRSLSCALCTKFGETSSKIAAGFVLLNRDHERGHLPITCPRVVHELLCGSHPGFVVPSAKRREHVRISPPPPSAGPVLNVSPGPHPESAKESAALAQIAPPAARFASHRPAPVRNRQLMVCEIKCRREIDERPARDVVLGRHLDSSGGSPVVPQAFVRGENHEVRERTFEDVVAGR